MNAEEIRSTFSHNAVYSLNKDEGMLISLQIMAIGELAAQLAENNALLKVAHGIPDDPLCRDKKCDYYKTCPICRPGSTSTKVCSSASKWEERLRA